MNIHIKAQIRNMAMMVDTFEQSCTFAATKDDGQISADEKKTLKKIQAASQRFKKEIEGLIKE